MKWIERPWLAAVLIASGFMVLSLVVNDLDRLLEYDEAIYLSEAIPSIPDVGFDAHRARGILVVGLPFGLLDFETMALFRGWLVVVHSAALALVIEVWRRVIGRAALLGGVVFATSWLFIFYSAELSPNLLCGQLAIAGVACVLISAKNGMRPWGWVGVTLIALAAFVRPTDAAWLAGGALVAAPLLGLPIRLAWGIPALGLLAGFMPWLIEAQVRFGGVLSRLRMASPSLEPGLSNQFVGHIHLLDGPLQGPDPLSQVAWAAMAWVGCIALLAVIALFSAVRSSRQPLLVLLGAAVGSAIPYLFLTSVLSPRFLLPTILSMSLIAGSALVAIKGQRVAYQALSVGAALLLVGSSIWQIGHAGAMSASQQALRTVTWDIAGEINAATDNRPCVFASQYEHPQIQVYTGCRGVPMSPQETTLPSVLAEGILEGREVFVVFFEEPIGGSPISGWPSRAITTVGGVADIYQHR